MSLLLRLLFPLALPVLLALPATGQAPADAAPADAVRAVIDQLFDGMRAGDSTAVRTAFHPAATMTSIGVRDGATMLREGSVDAFVQAVGTPHDAVWDERIRDVTIHLDDPLATAWVPYAFYLGEALSHCGVNAIHLVRGADGWRILSITDTRRGDGCAPPSDR